MKVIHFFQMMRQKIIHRHDFIDKSTRDKAPDEEDEIIY